MGIFSFLTTTPKTIDTAVETGAKLADGMMRGLDAMIYTDEEKANAKQKSSETLLEFWKVTAAGNMGARIQ